MSTVLKLAFRDANSLHMYTKTTLHTKNYNAGWPCHSTAVFSLTTCVIFSQVLDGHNGRYAAEQGLEYLTKHMLEAVQSGLDFPTVLVSNACPCLIRHG